MKGATREAVPVDVAPWPFALTACLFCRVQRAGPDGEPDERRVVAEAEGGHGLPVGGCRDHQGRLLDPPVVPGAVRDLGEEAEVGVRLHKVVLLDREGVGALPVLETHSVLAADLADHLAVGDRGEGPDLRAERELVGQIVDDHGELGLPTLHGEFDAGDLAEQQNLPSAGGNLDGGADVETATGGQGMSGVVEAQGGAAGQPQPAGDAQLHQGGQGGGRDRRPVHVDDRCGPVDLQHGSSHCGPPGMDSSAPGRRARGSVIPLAPAICLHRVESP
jgi:hypothetical protein